jgi:enediyne biosynthesis protein E4
VRLGLALAPLVMLLVMLTGVRAHQSREPSKASGARQPVMFTDVSKAAGLTFVHVNGASAQKFLVETMGSGGLFFDFDGDGWVDLLLVDGGSLADARQDASARHRLYRNRGDGSFEDVTARSGIVHREYGMGACAADYDNDGLVDLYVTGIGGNRLYRNVGGGRFRDVTSAAGAAASGWSTSCAFGDFDKDGFVDLFVTRYLDARTDNNRFCGDPERHLRVYCHPLNYRPLSSMLYHNNRNGTFADVSVDAGISSSGGNGLGVVIADYDDDGWPDIFVANDSLPNTLYRNGRRGRFEEVALLAGVAVANDGKPRAGMGTDFGDYDGDGLLDLIVTNHEFETTTLFRNLGRGLFADATTESGLGLPTLPFVGFGTALFDYDNDGWLDVAIANGHVVDNTAQVRAGSRYAQRRLLFHNAGGRRFVEEGGSSGSGFASEKVGRTLAFADVDNDGDLDLLVTNNGQSADLLRNDGGNRNHALQVRLVGRQSNRDAVGARVLMTVGASTQVREVKAGSSYLGQNDTRVHFGLGTAPRADRLEVRWPGGRSETFHQIQAGAIITIVEGEGITRRVGFSNIR